MDVHKLPTQKGFPYEYVWFSVAPEQTERLHNRGVKVVNDNGMSANLMGKLVKGKWNTELKF